MKENKLEKDCKKYQRKNTRKKFRKNMREKRL